MRNIFRGMLFVAMLLPASSAWSALITYEYWGERWDEIRIFDNFDDPTLFDYLNASQRFSTGSITIDSSLFPGGSIANTRVRWGEGGPGPIENPALISFSFFDGVIQYTPFSTVAWNLDFSTDFAGDIFAWEINLLTGPGPLDLSLSSMTGDYIDGVLPFTVRSSRPGTWTQVSEPGTLALMGFGVVGLAFLMRRRSGRA